MGVDKNTQKKVVRVDTGPKEMLVRGKHDLAVETTHPVIVKEFEQVYKALESDKRSDYDGKYVKTNKYIFKSIIKDIQSSKGRVIVGAGTATDSRGETLSFINGLYDGEYKQWYYNGQLAIIAFYKDGKNEGEYKRWYDNGQLWEHSFYKNDEYDGEWKQWHKNGQLSVHSFIKNGKENDSLRWHLSGVREGTERVRDLLQTVYEQTKESLLRAKQGKDFGSGKSVSRKDARAKKE